MAKKEWEKPTDEWSSHELRTDAGESRREVAALLLRGVHPSTQETPADPRPAAGTPSLLPPLPFTSAGSGTACTSGVGVGVDLRPEVEHPYLHSGPRGGKMGPLQAGREQSSTRPEQTAQNGGMRGRTLVTFASHPSEFVSRCQDPPPPPPAW